MSEPDVILTNPPLPPTRFEFVKAELVLMPLPPTTTVVPEVSVTLPPEAVDACAVPMVLSPWLSRICASATIVTTPPEPFIPCVKICPLTMIAAPAVFEIGLAWNVPEPEVTVPV